MLNNLFKNPVFHVAAHLFLLYFISGYCFKLTVEKTELSSLKKGESRVYIMKTWPCNIQDFFQKQKLKISLKKKKKDIFAQNIDCGYTLEPPRQGASNVYQSMF